MKIGVVGLWHLGSVTAVCLAEAGYEIVAFDRNKDCISAFKEGIPPIFENGLVDLLKKHTNKKLFFTVDPSDLSDCDIIWVTYDTPVDDNDKADTQFVEDEIEVIFPYIKEGAIVLISSQMPVCSIAKLKSKYNSSFQKNVSFCCSPENLRLGKAIEIFSKADRIICGINSDHDKRILEPVFEKFSENIVWMSVESAEMTKHAINAFLATSVVFINELAVLCEQVGADASEVEMGLKTESRIGPKAYLKPGSSFAGGTLARDINFLVEKGNEHQLPSFLFRSIKQSNDYHKSWMKNKLIEIFHDLKDKNFAILGLTYKPGTNTLRRSSSVELCVWLTQQGAHVAAYDPVIDVLPDELGKQFHCTGDLEAALNGADALIICTEWPEFRKIKLLTIKSLLKKPVVVVDPNNFLDNLSNEAGILHVNIGKSI